MDEERIRKEILDFMQKKLQIPIKDGFTFFDDTGIDGVDAFDLMYDFGIKFNVNMSVFNQDSYFTSEKDMLNFPKRLFMRIERGTILTFNIEHLVQVVIKGKWFDLDE